MTHPTHQFTARFPLATFQRLKARADRNKRSVNGELAVLVEAAIDADLAFHEAQERREKELASLGREDR